MIYVSRVDGTVIGKFSEEELRAKIAAGDISPDDQYFEMNSGLWHRASQFPGSTFPQPNPHEEVLPPLKVPVSTASKRSASAKLRIGAIIAGIILIALLVAKIGRDNDRVNAEAAKQLHEDISQAVENHRVLIGMRENEVIEAWGRPTTINRTVGQRYVSEQWVYEWRNGKTSYLYLDNGVLRSLQDSR